MIKNKWMLLLTLAFVAAFSVAMLIPVEYLPIDTRNDKIHHGILFVIMTWLFYGCLRINLFLLAGLMLAIAGLSELSQLLSPYRSSNWLDLRADAVGICFAIAILGIMLWLKRRGSLTK